jgi:predicted DNA-binding transcriptional regulator
MFDNYWVQHLGFFNLVQQNWNKVVRPTSSPSRIIAKLKNVRNALKYLEEALQSEQLDSVEQ